MNAGGRRETIGGAQMADHLTPFDAAFLELEDADSCSHMHVGWAMVFDPLPGGGVPDVDTVGELLVRRLAPLPRFFRRLSSPRIGRLSYPSWVEDEEFDPAHHVHRAAIPSPGGEAELLEWLGEYWSHRLDRARPLWEMTLLEGLERGRWAIAAKVHHALVDGVSGAAVTSLILDLEQAPDESSPRLGDGLHSPADNEDIAHDPFSALTHGARGAAGLARHPRRLAAILRRSRDLAEVLVRDELVGAPPTSLNVEIGSSRRMAAVAVPLDELKAIKNSLGGTVNDVVLATVAGGLRALLQSRGEPIPAQGIRAMVPVSIREAAELLTLGNRVSSLFVELPVAIPDGLARYRATAQAAEALKGGRQAAGSEALVALGGAAPPILHAALARLSFAPRLFNITITNVPGPQVTQYALGARMRRVIPLVPIFARHAVGIAAVSYDGELVFGVSADPAVVPDLDLLERGLRDQLEELRELAGVPAAGTPAAA
jgi:WS/DGAT/MGAT family acyltransferase